MQGPQTFTSNSESKGWLAFLLLLVLCLVLVHLGRGRVGEKPILEKHSKRKHPWRQDPSSPLAGAKLSVNYFAALPEPEGSKNTCGGCCWWVG